MSPRCVPSHHLISLLIVTYTFHYFVAIYICNSCLTVNVTTVQPFHLLQLDEYIFHNYYDLYWSQHVDQLQLSPLLDHLYLTSLCEFVCVRMCGSVYACMGACVRACVSINCHNFAILKCVITLSPSAFVPM